jgi:hypothetical protein
MSYIQVVQGIWSVGTGGGATPFYNQKSVCQDKMEKWDWRMGLHVPN